MRPIGITLALAAAVSAAGPADAGAWPREAGTTFLSFSYTATVPHGALDGPLDGWAAVYAERGVGRGHALGLDAGISAEGDATGLVFYRWPVGQGNGAFVRAVQLGAGATQAAGGAEPVLQAGASWGRGFASRLGNGWSNLDTQVLYRAQSGGVAAKADLTLGVKPGERAMWMIQVQTGRYPGSDAYLRLVPSVAVRIGDGAHAELGAQIGLAGDDRVGVKLGTWLEF